jgi:hypothetical protein
MMGTDPDFRSQSKFNRFGLNVYPHPFFDPANWYVPPTVKELYRWCSYLFLTNSVIGPICRKKASYVVTNLIYETDNPDTEKVYKHLLETTLRIKEFEVQMLLDFEVFGNAYCSVVYPFERYLICPWCNYENLLKNVEWVYEGGHFRAKCGNCKAHTTMEIKDKPVRNRSKVRLVRWFPQYVDVRYNVFTGASEFVLRIPRWMKTRIDNPKINKVYVKDTPKEFLEAIRDGKNIEFDPSNIYHMKNESISLEDNSMGFPSILNVFKDVWLWQTYKRGQEAIALEHALPMTLLSPMPAQGTTAPHLNVDLLTWQNKMMSIVEKWRRDQNALFTVPFPVQVSQVRGDAQALSLHNDMEQVRQQIAGGMDVPPDFLYGNVTWSGANVTLRVLENLLINRLSRISGFLDDWLVPNLRRFFRLPKCVVRHQDFKMADDIQQKQIAMNLRATNTVSDQTVLEELGFDYAKEQTRKKREFDDRIREMEKQQLAQAEIQAKIQIAQARIQQELNPQPAPEQGQPPLQEQVPSVLPPPAEPRQNDTISGFTQLSTSGVLSPHTVDLYANHFLKTTPPDEVERKLMFLKETEPVLARAIESRLKIIQEGAKAVEPLPEQKPPRRGAEKAVI